MKPIDYVLNHDKDVLAFLKTRYPLYHMSNVFFRDVQYGIQQMFDRKDVHVSYKEAEQIARAFVEMLEKKKVLVRIDRQSWVLNYEEFRTPPAKPAPAAKPAARPVAAAASGSGPARPLPPPSSAKPTGLPPPASGKPVGAPGGLPPPTSARAVGAPGALPPPTSARPAVRPGTLPPPTSAKLAANPNPSPIGAKPVAAPPASTDNEGQGGNEG